MQIRIEGSDFPGRACAAGPGVADHTNIHVGVQRRSPRDELLGLTAGDAASVTWTLDCDVVTTGDGIDFKGPYIQGRRYERFIYLSWGDVDAAGTFDMFRRAKLLLDRFDPSLIAAAERSGTLVGRLGLTDAKLHPLCAAVRPPKIVWSAE